MACGVAYRVRDVREECKDNRPEYIVNVPQDILSKSALTPFLLSWMENGSVATHAPHSLTQQSLLEHSSYLVEALFQQTKSTSSTKDS